MNAVEVKAALRRRHPATSDMGLGPWTCLEEFASIDLLAFSAWSSKKPPIVGYEVKISRSDYRRELLNPGKRAQAVAGCWEFYMATPAGLLTDEEKEYIEPEHFEDGGAFVRERCPAKPRCRKGHSERRRYLTPVEEANRRLSGHTVFVDVGFGDEACWVKDNWQAKRGDIIAPGAHMHMPRRMEVWVPCATCEGRGYMRKSVVEEEAPTLWIPNDVGLIEIKHDKCFVVRKAPRVKPTRSIGPIGHMVRWASFRPDPRHSA